MESYTIKVKAFETNSQGNPLIRALVPGITPDTNNPFPIPLNLTPEQGMRLDTSVTEYDATLVRGALRKDQHGNLKTGQYPDHFFYEVAMFDGIVNDAVMARGDSAPAPTPSAPRSQPVASGPQASTSSPDAREMVYRRQTGVNCASTLIAPLASEFESPEDMYQRLIELSERIVGYLSTGKADGLVDALIQDGASVTSVVEKEPVYDYPEPPKRLTTAAFEEYVGKAGWSWDDVTQWLGGLDPIDWISQEKARTYKSALKVCKDMAVELGLEPPIEFREIVSEA
jgi:hypothetical protein